MTAALARVRGPPPRWLGGAGGLESCVSRKKARSLPRSSSCKSWPFLFLASMPSYCFWVLSLQTDSLYCNLNGFLKCQSGHVSLFPKTIHWLPSSLVPHAKPSATCPKLFLASSSLQIPVLTPHIPSFLPHSTNCILSFTRSFVILILCMYFSLCLDCYFPPLLTANCSSVSTQLNCRLFYQAFLILSN